MKRTRHGLAVLRRHPTSADADDAERAVDCRDSFANPFCANVFSLFVSLSLHYDRDPHVTWNKYYLPHFWYRMLPTLRFVGTHNRISILVIFVPFVVPETKELNTFFRKSPLLNRITYQIQSFLFCSGHS